MERTKQEKAAIAKNAIDAIGGPLVASERIQSLSGRECSRDRIQKWLVNGIPAPWHPHVHMLTQIPLYELDPEIYPTWLFEQSPEAVAASRSAA